MRYARVAVIHVFSRHAVEAVPPFDEPHIFISIRSPWDDKPVRLRTNEHTLGVLRMAFHDLDHMPTPEELKVSYHIDWRDLFNARMARELLAFVRTHVLGKSVRPEIVINCDAGWSRSAAVAAGLEATLLEGDDAPWFRNKTPNMRVYRTIWHAFHDQQTRRGR